MVPPKEQPSKRSNGQNRNGLESASTTGQKSATHDSPRQTDGSIKHQSDMDSALEHSESHTREMGFPDGKGK